jgi:uncharacterized membrane protein
MDRLPTAAKPRLEASVSRPLPPGAAPGATRFVEPGKATPPPHGGRPGRWRPAEYGLVGVIVGLAFVWWSLSPSLLPRGPILQGVVSGVVGAVGYGLGAVLGELGRRAVGRDPSPAIMRRTWRILEVVGPAVTFALLLVAARQQLTLYRLLDQPAPARVGYLATVPITLVVAATLIQVARAVRWVSRRLTDRLDRHLARGVARSLSVVLVAVLLIGLVDGVLIRGLFAGADGFARAIDQAMPSDLDAPGTRSRSGGPGSGVPFEELGAKGREFITGGPSVVELAASTDRVVHEPVRVYVGLGAAPDERARAQVAVAELERSGGFTRDVLLVTVPTGTGWINPRPIDALEYLHAGNVATVAVQYSYLPSWISFLVDVGRAQDAGRELVNAVHARWEQLPEERRPELLVYGESLGALGAESAFSGLADLRNRTDGALFIGPPNFSPLWRDFVERRDPGTPERRPVFESGTTVRFAANAGDLAVPSRPWERPRVVYLQQASDPVVWWSPRLLLRRPDWLQEPRGDDVLADVHWFPVVTFVQLTVDLLNGYALDIDGYGHRYGGVIVDAWLAISLPDGWDDTERDEIEAALGWAAG